LAPSLSATLWRVSTSAAAPSLIDELVAALQETGGKRGVASLCIGGGEATAMAVELV
jgi:acetyl-CoA C-acetyltransferase